MSDEQLYVFVDKTGHCFEDFQTNTETKSNSDKFYRDHVGAMMKSGCKFNVGEMMAFKDDLNNADFKWNVDFYVKKVKNEL